ncbi:hypothetical protein BJX62DRAFT_179845 [Aspergillus germanicus]
MTSEATFICEQVAEDGLAKPCRAEIPGGGTSNTTIRSRGPEYIVSSQFFTPRNAIWGIPCRQSSTRCGSVPCTWQGVNQPRLVLAYAEFDFDGGLVTAPELAHEGVMLKNVTTCSISLCLHNISVSLTDAILSTTTLLVDRGQIFDRDEYQGHCTGNCWSSGADCWAPSMASPTNIMVREALFRGNNYNCTFAVNASEFTICSLRRFLAEPLVGNNSVIQDYHELSGREPLGTSRGPTRELGGPKFDQIANLGFETAMSNIAAALTQSSLEQSNSSITGTVHRVQTVVEVQWVWLILPAVVVALADVSLSGLWLPTRRVVLSCGNPRSWPFFIMGWRRSTQMTVITPLPAGWRRALMFPFTWRLRTRTDDYCCVAHDGADS